MGMGGLCDITLVESLLNTFLARGVDDLDADIESEQLGQLG